MGGRDGMGGMGGREGWEGGRDGMGGREGGRECAAERGGLEEPLVELGVVGVNHHAPRAAEELSRSQRAVHRPAILPAPAFVLRAVLGEMASLLLDSSRVRPGVAEERGYHYEFADVEKALDQVAH
jgi:hypothetical protein